MSRSLSLPEYFVDRSLGSRFVPAALRADGWLLRTHHEVFGDRDQNVADVEWLEFCGREDLVVLTKDRRIRYRPQELAVIETHAVRAFVLSSANLGADVQARRFLDQRELIDEHCREAGPFLYSVESNRIVRIFPE